MKHAAFAILFMLFFAPVALLAQQADSQGSLNETQEKGRLLFQQRCPICHSAVMITRRPYAAILFKGRVVGNEDRIRETIENGQPGRMPAFKYGMSSAEINSVIEYLKTVTTPFEIHPKGQPGAGSASESRNPNATE